LVSVTQFVFHRLETDDGRNENDIIRTMLFNNGALLVVYTTLIDQLPRPWGFQLSVLIFGGFVYSSLALMYRLASLEKNSAMKANNGNSYKLIKKVEIEGNYHPHCPCREAKHLSRTM